MENSNARPTQLTLLKTTLSLVCLASAVSAFSSEHHRLRKSHVGTDDTSSEAGTNCLGSIDAAGYCYKTYGVGPFAAYKLPGKDAGFNLQFNEDFDDRIEVLV